MHLNITYH